MSLIGNSNAKKHGMSNTRLYHIWEGMKRRCKNPKAKNYKNYGGKGISICDEWDRSFEVFYEWAMANGYEDGLTLDRIDVNGNYEPSNCRWASWEEQENNRSNNKYIEYNGQTKTIAEWTRIFGKPRHIVYHRLKRGWSIEKALTTEVRKLRCS